MEIIFLLVGALFIAVGGVIIFSELQARSGTQSVRGVVIGFSKGRNNSNGFSFHSVAEYIGLNGSKYFAEGSVGSSVPLHKVGAPVTILVRPTEPEKAVFKSPLSYVLGSVLALMGLASTTVFWLTFRASTMSVIVAAVVVGAFALKIKRAWRKEPMTLQAWQQYKKQTLSPRVFQSKDQISWADPMSISGRNRELQEVESLRGSNSFVARPWALFCELLHLRKNDSVS
jgi:uncharacterized protein DUF3592